jgi:hypothetical protein
MPSETKWPEKSPKETLEQALAFAEAYYKRAAEMETTLTGMDAIGRHADAFFRYLNAMVWSPEKAVWPFDDDGKLLPKTKR